MVAAAAVAAAVAADATFRSRCILPTALSTIDCVIFPSVAPSESSWAADISDRAGVLAERWALDS